MAEPILYSNRLSLTMEKLSSSCTEGMFKRQDLSDWRWVEDRGPWRERGPEQQRGEPPGPGCSFLDEWDSGCKPWQK